MITNNEPGALASITVGGVALIGLVGPATDILLEAGASPRLASAIVAVLMWAASVGAALWARSRTVSKQKHEATVDAALALPSNSDRVDLAHKLEAEGVKPDLGT